MTDLSKLSPAALSAAMRGGTSGWGTIGSATDNIRYAEPVSSRCRCHCGCKGRVTHNGMANGIALTSGCQLYVARWVKDPAAAIRAVKAKLSQEKNNAS